MDTGVLRSVLALSEFAVTDVLVGRWILVAGAIVAGPALEVIDLAWIHRGNHCPRTDLDCDDAIA